MISKFLLKRFRWMWHESGCPCSGPSANLQMRWGDRPPVNMSDTQY